jgi:hypothetical protein
MKMKKLGLLGLLLALAVVALATPDTPAYANPCLEACTDAVIACDAECYVNCPPSQGLPAYQACLATCRHEFAACRRSC